MLKLENFDDLSITLKGGKELKGLYFSGRVLPNEVPAGYTKLELREDDDLNGDIASVAKRIAVNFHGTFITKEDVSFLKEETEVEDWNFSPE